MSTCKTCHEAETCKECGGAFACSDLHASAYCPDCEAEWNSDHAYGYYFLGETN